MCLWLRGVRNGGRRLAINESCRAARWRVVATRFGLAAECKSLNLVARRSRFFSLPIVVREGLSSLSAWSVSRRWTHHLTQDIVG